MLDKNSTITNPVKGLQQPGFLLKVLAISAGIAVLIKYYGPSLAIPATSSVALAIVLLPTVLMAIALTWRYIMTVSKRR